MNKRVAIKSLIPGTRFLMDGGTVYIAENIRTSGGKTAVSYSIAGEGMARYSFVRPSLTSVLI